MIPSSDDGLSSVPPSHPVLTRDSTMTSFQTARADSSSKESLKLPTSSPPSQSLTDPTAIPHETPAPSPSSWGFKANPIWTKLSEKVELEGHGQAPLEVEQRTDAHFGQNFTLWLTMNATIACFSTGTLGPLLYSLSFRDSALVIVFFNLFSCGIPAAFSVAGPRLGMRTMGVARFSFGYFGATLPAFLNLVTFIGFCAVNAIVGGQTLSAINPDSLSVNVGIIIIAIVSMVVSFCGYKVLHQLEKYAWMFTITAFIFLTGIGGKQLASSVFAFEAIPATAGSILSFATIIVGFSISWSGCSADFNTYMRPDISSAKVFFYTFAGLYLPSMFGQVLGAAFGAAALSGVVTSWSDAFENYSTGGLLGAILEPFGGFGKFLLVILGLGMICNNAPSAYAFSLSCQIVFPFLSRFPRFLFPVLCTVIYLPIAIVGATSFAAALNNFLGMLGYWAAVFVAIVAVEHFAFRKGKFSEYTIEDWNNRSLLPNGIPALFASAVGLGAVVVSMDQVYWRGPIAIAIAGPDATYGGDLGFELGMVLSGLAYYGARSIEKKYFGGR